MCVCVLPLVLVTVFLCLALSTLPDHKHPLSKSGCAYTSLPHDTATQLVHSALAAPLSQPWLFGTWCSWVGLSGMFWNKASTGECYWRLPVIHFCLVFSGWVMQTTERGAFADSEQREGAGDLPGQGPGKGCYRENDYSSLPPPILMGNNLKCPFLLKVS